MDHKTIVTWRLKAGTAEPEKTFIARQQLDKQVPAATNEEPAIQVLLSYTYLLTELSPSWEAANCAATQELPSILRNPKVHRLFYWIRPEAI
jgi:hypothetical protein